jgi:hypothetical protein
VIYKERKVLRYKLMNFDIVYWKSILKINQGEIIPDYYKNYYLKGHIANFQGRLAHTLTLTLVCFHGRPAHTYSSGLFQGWTTHTLTRSIFMGDLPTHVHPGLFSGATGPHTHTGLFSRVTYPHTHTGLF